MADSQHMEMTPLSASIVGRGDLCKSITHARDVVGPATPMQEVMYASALMGKTRGLDVEHIEIDCPTGLDARRFAGAIEQWVLAFETLRTGFERNEHGGVVQVRYSQSAIPLKIIDLATLSEEEATRTITQHRHETAAIGFDLARPPLVRATLFQMSSGRSRAILTLHHLIYDGRCAADLLAGLFDEYDAHNETSTHPLEEATPSFSEFAVAVRSREAEASRPFFESLLAGFDGSVDLRLAPQTDELSVAQSPVGYVIRYVPAAILDDLTSVAKRLGGTVNTLFQVAWAVLLARYSGTSDVVWGTTRACRYGVIPGSERVIGMCINTVPCRLDAAGHQTLAQAVGELRQQHIDIRPHEHTSAALVHQWCGRAGTSRLFSTLAVFERFIAEREVSRLISNETPRSARIYSRTGFDLTVMLSAGDAPQIELVYERAKVQDAIAERVVTHLTTLFSAMVKARPDAMLADLPHVPQEDQLLLKRRAWADSRSFPRDTPLHVLFEQTVDSDPKASCLKDNDREFTYGEVDAWANRLAEVIREYGITPGAPVPILTGRSIQYIVAALAVLKAGGAYSPIELSAPAARLAQIWKTLKPGLAIGLTETASLLSDSGARTILMDQVDLSSRSPVRRPAETTELANVIFTSGSTGQPKGVMIPHRAIARVAYNHFLPFDRADVYLLLASVAFDVSTLEIWAPLLTGATLAVFSEEVFDFEKLRMCIRNHGVTRLWLTSSLFNAVIDADPQVLRGVKTVMAGGEALSPSHVARAQAALPDTVFVNGYGPTESTVFTCTHAIPTPDRKLTSIPIGRPIEHTIALPLDLHGQPVDTGFAGELFIGGDGLAMGYLRDERLTSERFVTCKPFGSADRFYRSGDLVRVLPEGLLDFVERIDGQIKLRGYRIDPGEIETAIMSYAGVKNAAVIARGVGVDKQLIAFIVAERSGLDLTALRCHLKALLPDYMLPPHLVIVEQMPMTLNGKLDRAALGRMDITNAQIVTGETQPADDTEQLIQQLFAAVLGTPHPSVDQGIIELGFNSLSILDLSLRLEREFGHCFSNHALAGNPSVRDLAQFVRGEMAPASISAKLLLPVGGGEAAPPLFMIPGLAGDPLELMHLAKEMGQDRQIYIFRSPGRLPGETPKMSISDLAGDLVDALSTAYPVGPIHILGYSFGAQVAYETAYQLRKKGRSIPFLALIDSPTIAHCMSFNRQLLMRLNRLRKKAGRIFPIIGWFHRFSSHKIAQPAVVEPRYSEVSRREQSEVATIGEWKMAARPAGSRSIHDFLVVLNWPVSKLRNFKPVERCALFAFAQYQPPPYQGDEVIHLFVCRESIKYQSRYLGWRRIIGQWLRLWILDGHHVSIVNQKGSLVLAGFIRDILSDLRPSPKDASPLTPAVSKG